MTVNCNSLGSEIICIYIAFAREYDKNSDIPDFC